MSRPYIFMLCIQFLQNPKPSAVEQSTTLLICTSAMRKIIETHAHFHQLSSTPNTNSLHSSTESKTLIIISLSCFETIRNQFVVGVILWFHTISQIEEGRGAEVCFIFALCF